MFDGNRYKQAVNLFYNTNLPAWPILIMIKSSKAYIVP